MLTAKVVPGVANEPPDAAAVRLHELRQPQHPIVEAKGRRGVPVQDLGGPLRKVARRAFLHASDQPAIDRPRARVRACGVTWARGQPVHACASSNAIPSHHTIYPDHSRPRTRAHRLRNLAAARLECACDGAAADSTRGAAASPSTPSSMRAMRLRRAPLPMYMLGAHLLVSEDTPRKVPAGPARARTPLIKK
jgi:hypothetical protein